MPLCSMKKLLSEAAKNNCAVGAFSVINMETVLGAVRAAEQTNSPIILQVGEPRLKHAPLDLIGPLMVKAAQKASVPIAVHMDHAENLSTIHKAIEVGFSSVMIDASHLPFAENISLTRATCGLAHENNVDCEGEIGRLGLNEDNTKDFGMAYTDVAEAKTFAEQTGVDALAVAIGNMHGLHENPTALNFTRLEELHKAVSVPLVLHGGSGISEEDFKRCVAGGMRKVNIATATVFNMMLKAQEFFRAMGGAEIQSGTYYGYHDLMIEAACEAISRHIEIFGSQRILSGGEV